PRQVHLKATDPQAAVETTLATPAEWDKTWSEYCKYAVGLHLNEVSDLKADLEAGRRPDVTEPALMAAAIELVGGMAAAGVRRWDWLPPPSPEDLANPADWVARRLAAQRAAQDEANRIRRQQEKLARAQGRSRSAASGTINPIHLQQSKHDRDELARRLEWVIDEHTKRGGFRRENLDHRSPHYITDAKGGISNKQIVLLANL